MSVLAPHTPSSCKSLQANMDSLGVTAKQSLREGNSNILFNIKGLLKSCPYSAPEKDIIFIILDSKQSCSLLWEPLLLSFKAVCCTNTQWEKTESIPSKIRNKKRVSTFTTIIQHNFESPSYSNQRRKRNKKNPGWKRKSKAFSVCR